MSGKPYFVRAEGDGYRAIGVIPSGGRIALQRSMSVSLTAVPYRKGCVVFLRAQEEQMVHDFFASARPAPSAKLLDELNGIGNIGYRM